MRDLTTALALAVIAAACGSSTTPAPIVSMVAGTWSGTVTATAVSGGPECLDTFRPIVGVPDRYTLVATQTGTTVFATDTSETSGRSCDYEGTAGNGLFSIAASACHPGGMTISCSGTPRDVYVVKRLLTMTVSGNALDGTGTDTWSVFPVGTTVGSLAQITVSSHFVLTR